MSFTCTVAMEAKSSCGDQNCCPRGVDLDTPGLTIYWLTRVGYTQNFPTTGLVSIRTSSGDCVKNHDNQDFHTFNRSTGKPPESESGNHNLVQVESSGWGFVPAGQVCITGVNAAETEHVLFREVAFTFQNELKSSTHGDTYSFFCPRHKHVLIITTSRSGRCGWSLRASEQKQDWVSGCSAHSNACWRSTVGCVQLLLTKGLLLHNNCMKKTFLRRSCSPP